jgi:hypothetical protein
MIGSLSWTAIPESWDGNSHHDARNLARYCNDGCYCICDFGCESNIIDSAHAKVWTRLNGYSDNVSTTEKERLCLSGLLV